MNRPAAETQVYLRSYLAPLDPYLTDPAVTDILVNRAGEAWVERSGGAMVRVELPTLTEQGLLRLARQVAAGSHQGINRERPLLSASLPDGARIQIVAPPATRGGVAIGIRRHGMADLSMAALGARGLFAPPVGDQRAERDMALDALRTRGDWQGFLVGAVRARKTVVLSGGTASGKTTLLNALVKEIDAAERLIAIEDAPEIVIDRANALGLIATRGEQGEARVEAEDLLQAAMRLRPDRILLGELRGKEAFAFLRAVNTGHPGSLTTVHADHPRGAIDQIAMLALMAGIALDWHAIRRYASGVIDYVVQLERGSDGRRRVTDIAAARELMD